MTQSGFPWGRTAPSGPNVTPPGDVGRLASLAVFYSQFANGDVVQATLLQKLGFPAKVIVAPHPDASGNLGTVPFIDFIAVAPLAAESIQASKEAAAELRQYVIDQQASAGIAPADRVQLQVISTPRKALQLAGPSKTLPQPRLLRHRGSRLWCDASHRKPPAEPGHRAAARVAYDVTGAGANGVGVDR